MIDPQELDRLFGIEEAMKGMGLEGLSPQEIRSAMQQKPKGMMSPMSRPGVPPQAGFQGNSMFPNQGGGGMLLPGQQPPPMSAPSLNPMGQPMQGGVNPQFPGQSSMMAQAGGQPGPMGGGMQPMGQP